MDGACADLLSSPGFSGDQYAGIAASERWNFLDLVNKSRAVAHELLQAEFFLQKAK